MVSRFKQLKRLFYVLFELIRCHLKNQKSKILKQGIGIFYYF
jgi:hypothetical protein